MKKLALLILLSAALVCGATITPVTTTITADLGAADRVLSLASAANLRPMTEVAIGNELILVCSVNKAKNTALVCSYGRGRQGTTAAAHSSGAVVLINPGVRQDASGNLPTTGATLPAAVGGGTIPSWNKYVCDVTSNAGFWTCNGTKGAALATAATQKVALVTLPARAVVHAMMIKHSVAGTGGTLSALTYSVGTSGTVDALMTTAGDKLNGFAAPATTGFYVASLHVLDTAATALILNVAATGANVSELTAGTVEVDLLTSVLP